MSLLGEFDVSSRQHLSDALASLRERGCRALDVDASGVTFIDASCLRVLEREGARLRLLGGGLAVTSGSTKYVRLVRAAWYPDLQPPPAVPAPVVPAARRELESTVAPPEDAV